MTTWFPCLFSLFSRGRNLPCLLDDPIESPFLVRLLFYSYFNLKLSVELFLVLTPSPFPFFRRDSVGQNLSQSFDGGFPTKCPSFTPSFSPLIAYSFRSNPLEKLVGPPDSLEEAHFFDSPAALVSRRLSFSRDSLFFLSVLRPPAHSPKTSGVRTLEARRSFIVPPTLAPFSFLPPTFFFSWILFLFSWERTPSPSCSPPSKPVCDLRCSFISSSRDLLLTPDSLVWYMCRPSGCFHFSPFFQAFAASSFLCRGLLSVDEVIFLIP